MSYTEETNEQPKVLYSILLKPTFETLNDWLLENRVFVKKDFDDIVAGTLVVPLLNYLINNLGNIITTTNLPCNILSLYYERDDLIQDSDDLLRDFSDYLTNYGYDVKKEYLLCRYEEYHAMTLMEISNDQKIYYLDKLNKGLSVSGEVRSEERGFGTIIDELSVEREYRRIFSRAEELNIPLPFYSIENNTDSSGV